jgi:enamine deaminase RidA (YjgF/YER057c/UK114 family)
VVRVGVFLRDIKDFQAMNAVYSTFFLKDPPARTTVQATLAGNFLVEIDAVALKSA